MSNKFVFYFVKNVVILLCVAIGIFLGFVSKSLIALAITKTILFTILLGIVGVILMLLAVGFILSGLLVITIRHKDFL